MKLYGDQPVSGGVGDGVQPPPANESMDSNGGGLISVLGSLHATEEEGKRSASAFSGSVAGIDDHPKRPPARERKPLHNPAVSAGGNNNVESHDAIIFLRGVLTEAISKGASDVHLEPFSDSFRVRFRIDGVLSDYTRRPIQEYSSLLNGAKVLADLDIATHWLPQDGHIELMLQEVGTGNNLYYDIRISVFPSVNGEVIVLRILNRANALLSMEELGMDADAIAQLRSMLLYSYGMMLVTGPTGSGKTTTLYSILSEVKSDDKNIITLEDPIEFHLEWMRQCEINVERGFTYEKAMSSVLRQDPDVLMVGEIRDQRTAEYAIRSALVGHMLGSTIHANTAIGTVARLLELGIPRSILAHTLNGIIAQRLIRMICNECREEYTPNAVALSHLGLQNSSGPFVHGRGCQACNNSGYKGRTGIFSVMLLDETLRTLILDQRPLAEIQDAAIRNGMRTLKMDAAAKVLAGVTTVEEVVRVV
jgi:type II secretory ATPase GspE/PulE/Tfp pilus assembly ATPase PilB-like protein